MPAKKSDTIGAAAAGFRAATMPTERERPRAPTPTSSGDRIIKTSVDLTPAELGQWKEILGDLTALAGRNVTRRQYVRACISPEGRALVAKALGLLP